MHQITTFHEVHIATGYRLDMIGRGVGLSRDHNESDAEYRQSIITRMREMGYNV